VTNDPQPHEAGFLHLDSTKANRRLGWRPVWSLDEALRATADWYRAHVEHGEVISAGQLRAYETAARVAGLAWCG
jgi:CDP-glucose 4,6-dehydratase